MAELLSNVDPEEVEQMRVILERLIGSPISPGTGIAVEVEGRRYEFGKQDQTLRVAAVVVPGPALE